MKKATLVLVRPDPKRPEQNHPTDVALAQRHRAAPPCWVLLIGGSLPRAGKDPAAAREGHRIARHEAIVRELDMEGIAKDGLSVFAPIEVAGEDDPNALARELSRYLAGVGFPWPLRVADQVDVYAPADLDPALLAAVIEAASVHPRVDVWIGVRKLSASLRWEQRRDLFHAPSARPSTDLIGSTPAIEKVRQKVVRYADKPSPVLIIGETGTGKEVVANMLHEQSGRQGRFMPQNAAQLSTELADSLLFGHTKGAFTGADADRAGRIREAHGGTFFLDEVFNLAPAVQGKLLRALNEVESGVILVESVGSTRPPERVHARLVASALADPRADHKNIGTSAMRTDLFYRVSAGIIRLPPLRETLDDLPVLCAAILRRIDDQVRVTSDGIAALRDHDWPGNIRELRLILLRALMDAPGRVEALGPDALRAALETNRLPNGAPSLPLPCDLKRELRKIEVATMRAALREVGHNQAQAGRRIGMGAGARNFGRDLAKAEKALNGMGDPNVE